MPPRITLTKLPHGHRNLLGSALRSLREARSLTQAAVVGRLQRRGWDISRHVYGFIEDGSRQITDIELFGILQALKCSPADLEDSFRAFSKK